MLAEQLPSETDPENMFRALTTLHALVRPTELLCPFANPRTKIWHDEAVKNVAGELEVKAAVLRIQSAGPIPKVKEAADNALVLLS